MATGRQSRSPSSASAEGADDGSPLPSSAPFPRWLTVTQRDQLATEAKVFEILRSLNAASSETPSIMFELWRDKHIEFLSKGLEHLGPSYYVLDANRPWLCYWILHSLALLGDSVDSDMGENVVEFLSRCQDSEGGYGGGPDQLPHLATTYAAVNTLITLGNERALSSINRHKMRSFLLRMKDLSGAFRMHDGGEIDVRACYTAISVASSLNILDEELMKNVGDYILSCQTYEGGIAGEPGSEAHGGYTFCGLATMILINEASKLDLCSLIDWVTFRQGVECGFQGRTNKLVDGCYSFWQGGVLALIQRIMQTVNKQVKSSMHQNENERTENRCSTSSYFSGESETDEHPSEGIETCSKKTEGQHLDAGFRFLEQRSEWGPLFHSIALQQYVLLCCQTLDGGFRDKPGKRRDHYHSCYCLSGLALCQYSWAKGAGSSPPDTTVLGPYSNLLEPIHPLYNVVLDKFYKGHEFFYGIEDVSLASQN